LLLVVLLLGCLLSAQLLSSQLSELNSIQDTSAGRWALLFLPTAGPEADSARGLFIECTSAFPEMRFAIIARDVEALPQPEAVPQDVAPLAVMADPAWVFESAQGYSLVPIVEASVEGVFVIELAWPFTEVQLIRALVESLTITVEFPDPTSLIGTAAPSFVFTDSAGRAGSLWSLPTPTLLVFVNPDCHPCLDALPLGTDIPGFVSIALVVAAAQGSVDSAQMEQLSALREGFGAERTTIAFASDAALVAYNISRSPTLVLIDASRTIAWASKGETTRDALTAVLQAECAGMAVSPSP
jgi:hypothetical protein